MKSDSLIKVTASMLSLSLLASTCFTTVSEAAGSSKGIISENPVTVSAYMMQSMKSSVVNNVISNTTTDVASNVEQKAELNKGTTEQEKTTEVRSAKDEISKIVSEIKTNDESIGIASPMAVCGALSNIVTVQNVVEEKNVLEADSPEASQGIEVQSVSAYEGKGIAIEDVVNIRKEANTTSEILGRMYKGAICSILKDKNGWVLIQSGDVKGYIRKDLLAIGEAAEEIAPKYAKKYAVINTTTLKVREKNNTESTVLTLVGQDEKYRVVKEGEVWCKIKIDDETVGFVLKEYVEIVEKFDHAETMEEIMAAMAEDEEENQQQSSTTSSKSSKSSKKTKKSTRRSTSSRKSSSSKKTYSKAGSKTGSNVASFALQFKGNPYVYGGTSLTNGTDCSGFTQSVYRNFGYSIPRDSRSQYSSAGRIVSMNELQPGDLLFYGSSSGRINHVALYIGGGQVVHASNRKDGIKVSNYRYRTPLRARRVIN